MLKFHGQETVAFFIPKLCRLTPVLLAGVLLASCGGSNETAKAPDSQVVARIGPDVVTIQDLDNELRLTNVPPERRKDTDVVRKTVSDLVARKMLARRALNGKLDREPTVLLDLLRAKDVVLAEAATGRAINARLSALSNSDLEKYIQGNPLKFANRQILQTDQLIVPSSAITQSIIDGSRTAKSLEEIAQVLTSASVPFGRSAGAINTAEMPDELMAAIRSQGLEGVLFVRAGANAAFLKIRGQETRPLTGQAAEAMARQMMRADLLKGEASMAAFTANLEATYVGEYAKIMGSK